VRWLLLFSSQQGCFALLEINLSAKAIIVRDDLFAADNGFRVGYAVMIDGIIYHGSGYRINPQ